MSAIFDKKNNKLEIGDKVRKKDAFRIIEGTLQFITRPNPKSQNPWMYFYGIVDKDGIEHNISIFDDLQKLEASHERS